VETSSNETKPIHSGLTLRLKPISSHLLQAVVEVSSQTVKALHKQALSLYAKNIQPHGLREITLPEEIVEQEHAVEIRRNIKKFIFKHFVLDYLLNQISAKKITFANHPRLTKMELEPNGRACYSFDISVAAPIPLKEWKLFSFKTPRRKRYKDLDKQVDLFIRNEQELHKKQDQKRVESGDWVNFEAVFVNENKQAILPLNKATLWMKVNTKYVEKPFQKLFIGKQAGDTFFANAIPIDEELRDTLSHHSHFLVTVKSITKGGNISIEAFKMIFKLKNKSELHRKLIEVFSYRNDISQRRSIIEEVFHLLFSKHRFEIPKHLIIRKQESLLITLKKQPDYQVYKAQRDFGEKITMLSEKLLKEEILIDQIAYRENIRVARKDIRHYLSLFNNNRLREFVYFKPSFEPIEENELPMHEGYLKQAVLREKTLNHIISSLAG